MASLMGLLILAALGLMLAGGGVLLVAVGADPRPFGTLAETTNSTMSFARAFLGIGLMMAGCFCGILARIAQAAIPTSQPLPATVPATMAQADSEREVARLMRESASR